MLLNLKTNNFPYFLILCACLVSGGAVVGTPSRQVFSRFHCLQLFHWIESLWPLGAALGNLAVLVRLLVEGVPRDYASK